MTDAPNLSDSLKNTINNYAEVTDTVDDANSKIHVKKDKFGFLNIATNHWTQIVVAIFIFLIIFFIILSFATEKIYVNVGALFFAGLAFIPVVATAYKGKFEHIDDMRKRIGEIHGPTMPKMSNPFTDMRDKYKKYRDERKKRLEVMSKEDKKGFLDKLQQRADNISLRLKFLFANSKTFEELKQTYDTVEAEKIKYEEQKQIEKLQEEAKNVQDDVVVLKDVGVDSHADNALLNSITRANDADVKLLDTIIPKPADKQPPPEALSYTNNLIEPEAIGFINNGPFQYDVYRLKSDPNIFYYLENDNDPNTGINSSNRYVLINDTTRITVKGLEQPHTQ